MTDSGGNSKELLTSLLREVSRSFYLTLRILPGEVRSQIGLAYLLARATDTIADTELVPLEERLAALDRLRSRIQGANNTPLHFTSLIEATAADPAASSGEKALLQRIEDALIVLAAFPADDQKLIRQVLETITSGQELDLRRFALAGPQRVVALQNGVELDDYTYRVAGCVGEFWTHICRRHQFPKAPLDEALLLDNGVRFGKGLQLVNILRDLPADVAKGRCYLPADELAAAGLTPGSLADPASEERLRPVYATWLKRARGHLAAGWDYTNALPRNQRRVRLACAWPILIGIKTLEKLETSAILARKLRIKISRAEVRGILFRSIICYPWPNIWRRLAQFPRA